MKYQVEVQNQTIYVHSGVTGTTVARFTKRLAEFGLDGNYGGAPNLSLSDFSDKCVDLYDVNVLNHMNAVEVVRFS